MQWQFVINQESNLSVGKSTTKYTVANLSIVRYTIKNYTGLESRRKHDCGRLVSMSTNHFQQHEESKAEFVTVMVRNIGEQLWILTKRQQKMFLHIKSRASVASQLNMQKRKSKDPEQNRLGER